MSIDTELLVLIVSETLHGHRGKGEELLLRRINLDY